MTEQDRQRGVDRGTINPTVDAELPGYGDVTYRFRNSDLAIVEDKLLELGEVEYTPPPSEETPDPKPIILAGWDALEVWATTRPFRVVPLLVYAGLRHDGWTPDDVDEHLSPAAMTDENTVAPIFEALAKALGSDRAKPTKRAAKSASSAAGKGPGSTGGSSTTAGRPRSSSAASASPRRPSPRPPQD